MSPMPNGPEGVTNLGVGPDIGVAVRLTMGDCTVGIEGFACTCAWSALIGNAMRPTKYSVMYFTCTVPLPRYSAAKSAYYCTGTQCKKRSLTDRNSILDCCQIAEPLIETLSQVVPYFFVSCGRITAKREVIQKCLSYRISASSRGQRSAGQVTDNPVFSTGA